MSDNTLLSKSIFTFKLAQKILLYEDDGDEQILNVVGYHLQQAAELFLKHFLETESTGFPFTHNITTLIDLVIDRELSIKLTEKFKLSAGLLTEWEASTRYIKDYIASRRAILDVIAVLQELFLVNGFDCSIMDVTKSPLVQKVQEEQDDCDTAIESDTEECDPKIKTIDAFTKF